MVAERQVRLTSLASCAGCAAKMGADALARAVRPLTATFGVGSDDLLVGLGKADDAAVYRLNDEQAIVATTDFFPPVVDDPYSFGAVAAANALSDIYAMGGDPLLCLNLVAFPETLDADILTEILRGGADTVRAAGAIIAGGHSISDDEPKYGLAAIGLIHPQRILTKGGARPGDRLLLTKPIGAGAITTAAKAEAAQEEHLAGVIATMTTLNAAASRVLRGLDADIHACTDVTGFGLLGHGWEMAAQSGAVFRFVAGSVPLLPGARTYAEAGHIPGGTRRNRDAVRAHVTFAEGVDKVQRLLLLDPQTSGGLLAAVAPERADAALAALAAAGVPAVEVGTVLAGDAAHIQVEA